MNMSTDNTNRNDYTHPSSRDGNSESNEGDEILSWSTGNEDASFNESSCEEHGQETSVSVFNENNASPTAESINVEFSDVNNNVETMNDNSSFISNGLREAESSPHVDSFDRNVDDTTALTAAASSEHVDTSERNVENAMSLSAAVLVRDGIDNENNVTTDIAEDSKRAAIGKKAVHKLRYTCKSMC